MFTCLYLIREALCVDYMMLLCSLVVEHGLTFYHKPVAQRVMDYVVNLSKYTLKLMFVALEWRSVKSKESSATDVEGG